MIILKELELFDKEFPHKMAEVIDDFGNGVNTKLKNHLISSHIRLLEEMVERMKLLTPIYQGRSNHTREIGGKEMKTIIVQALQDTITNLKKELR
jgi:hypothetical protein